MTSDNSGQIVAAIDIGSNSIKMTVGRSNDRGGIDQFDWSSEVVRLGMNLDSTGRLDEERVEAAIETLIRFAARARELGATRVVAVATEATRAAANGASFLERAREAAGIEVRAVDGQEEAALTFRGIAASTDMTGAALIADIGGGSTELIAARDGAMQSMQSIPLGSGRLTDRLVVTDPPAAAELAACESEAEKAIRGAAGPLELPTGKGTRLIVVGGTGEYLARLVPDAQKINLSAVREVLTRLRTRSAAELAAEIDIPEARARVLPAGVAIVAAIARWMKPDRIEISQSGIRTGLLIETLHPIDTAVESVAPENRVTSGTEDVPGRRNARSPGGQNSTTETDFRETMKTLIAERWEAVWRAIPVALQGTDIEGVHDVRVASRRLRAAMDIAAPVFPRGWYRSFHRAAKEITGALGAVRDRDVLLEALHADRKTAPLVEQPGIDRLIARVERERADARVEMEGYLRRLLSGPLPGEIERRFKATEKSRDAQRPSTENEV